MTKPSIEERLLDLEAKNLELQRLVELLERQVSDRSPNQIHIAKTFDQGTPAYPTAPANVFPIKLLDIEVDTATVGDQTVTKRDRSDEVQRNVFSGELIPAGTEIVVFEHLGHYHAIRGGGSSVNIIRGLAKGSIVPFGNGEIDQLAVVTGTYATIANGAQVQEVYNDTTSFTIENDAWVIAVQRGDGTWYVLNAECVGEATIQEPEYQAIAAAGIVSLQKRPKVIIDVTSESGKSLMQGSHYNINAPLKRLEMIAGTQPGGGPVLYEGGYLEGDLVRIVYTSAEV